jgi:hypothetical protein
MFAPTTGFERRVGIARVLVATAVMAVALLASATLTRHHVPTSAEVWAAAGLTAAATLVVATMFVRETPFPRGAYLVSAFLLAGAVLLTAAYPGDPSHWARETRDVAWIFPWFFISLHAGVARRTSACTYSAAKWLLPLSAALLALAIHLPFLLDR